MELLTSFLYSVKKRFNIASPSFTPSSLAVNGNHATAKTLGLSPKAANAAPFKPRTLTPGNVLRTIVKLLMLSKYSS